MNELKGNSGLLPLRHSLEEILKHPGQTMGNIQVKRLMKAHISYLAPKRDWKYSMDLWGMSDCGGCTVRQIRRERTITHTIMICTCTLVGSVPIINNAIIGAVYISRELYYTQNFPRLQNNIPHSYIFRSFLCDVTTRRVI